MNVCNPGSFLCPTAEDLWQRTHSAHRRACERIPGADGEYRDAFAAYQQHVSTCGMTGGFGEVLSGRPTDLSGRRTGSIPSPSRPSSRAGGDPASLRSEV